MVIPTVDQAVPADVSTVDNGCQGATSLSSNDLDFDCDDGDSSLKDCWVVEPADQAAEVAVPAESKDVPEAVKEEDAKEPEVAVEHAEAEAAEPRAQDAVAPSAQPVAMPAPPPEADDVLLEWRSMLEHGLSDFASEEPQLFRVRLRHGIPQQCRWAAWRALLGSEWRAEQGLYERLLAQESQWLKLIRVDAPRTFPGMSIFDQEYQRVLVRVLHAYSNQNPKVGYCQGMNFIAGLLLLVSQCQEEETFFALCVLMDERQLSGFFEEKFPLLRVYIRAFDQLMAETLPDLRQHLASQCLEAEIFLQQWYLSLFINCLPLPAVLIIWDSVALEGLPVLLRVAVARLMSMRSTLLGASFEDVMRLLRRPRLGDQGEEEAAASVGRLLMQQSDEIAVPPRILRMLREPLAEANPQGLAPAACCSGGVWLLLRSASGVHRGARYVPGCAAGLRLLANTADRWRRGRLANSAA